MHYTFIVCLFLSADLFAGNLVYQCGSDKNTTVTINPDTLYMKVVSVIHGYTYGIEGYAVKTTSSTWPASAHFDLTSGGLGDLKGLTSTLVLHDDHKVAFTEPFGTTQPLECVAQ